MKEEFQPKFPAWANDNLWTHVDGKLAWVRSRYKILYGGRGSSKSWTVGYSLVLLAHWGKFTILCGREIQNSIKDSSKRLLENIIDMLGLRSEFHITQDQIINVSTGTTFIFRGLKDIEQIKSIEGIDYCWVEEAQTLSQHSLDGLIPTIRKPNSEIIFTFNPRFEDDPVYAKWVKADVLPPRSIVKLINFYDNPFLPEVLHDEAEFDKENDFDKYNHVWLGNLVTHSDRQVFYKRWRTTSESINPPKGEVVYNGMDFGFSQDPLALISCWIDDDKKELYIFRAVSGKHIEIDEHPKMIDKLLGNDKKAKIVADNARPEIISYCNKRGYNINGCKKLEIKTGIAFLRNYTIVVHDSLKDVIQELILYSYKVDKRTDEITDIIEDKNNHFCDALRYAVEEITVKKISTSKWL